jgi:signal transduction histidine kinase/CheY-like chemotaxis protein/HPt (histidine-containing phosphotransfer) domain-containing protein
MNRFERAFAESSVALAILDEAGYIVEANANFRLVFEAIAGRSILNLDESFIEFLRARDAFRFGYHFSRLAGGACRSINLDTPFRASGGDMRQLKIRAWLLPKEEAGPPAERGPFIACLVDDATEQNQLENRLQTAKDAAERATETKSQFLANMSHEIRTPIQTIIGTTELLQETKLDREQAEYARQVKFSADVLLSLINDILDFTKIEAGRLRLETADVNFAELVRQSVELVCLEAHAKNLEMVLDLAADLPATLRGDPTRLRQIIVNLVKNAVKFTKSGEIVVSARRSEYQGKEAVTLAVADSGIGVAPELRSRLFTTFFQGDATTTRRFGGTGLGLSISRHLTQLMGGEIGMRPNDGQGSVFYFTFPAERSEFGDAAPSASVPAEDRVLAVDDHGRARRVLVDLLAGFGFAHIDEAASGQEALQKMEAAVQAGRPYGLCFIDQVMPQMDGWRLAAEINANKRINQARLILMVPRGSLGADTKMTLLRWFNAYVYKPISRPDLAEVLSAAVQPLDLEGSEPAALPGTAPAAAADGPPAKAETGNLAGLPVLVVEDHPINRKLFAVILERLGCSVVLAEDGVDAVAAAERQAFALVFMDIQMPRLNGYEATEKLRGLRFAAPIIAVTASAMPDEWERCRSAGMDDILVKPFKREDIEAKLRRWSGAAPAAATSARAEELEELESLDPEPDGDLGAAAEPARRKAPADAPVTAAPAAAFSPAAGEAPPAAQVFDGVALLETFLGERDTVVSLLDRYLVRTAEQIDGLPRLLADAEWEKLRHEAHAIKGSALNLSAKELGGLAAKLEQSAKDRVAESAAAALSLTPAAFARFRAAAERFIAGA